MNDSRKNWQFILLPLSWLYGGVVRFRNLLFDLKMLRSENFSVPVISVGNITVGGTGKTPHIEYLVRLLSAHKVAVLSRGYKRKSSGFVLATLHSNAAEIGDEARQIKQKFPNVVLAVDANRRRGISKLLELEPDIEVILLDDAFQHRYVKPDLSIVLVDYNRPVYYDRMLPSGDLRESVDELRRAQIIIVSKTPANLKPIDRRVVLKHIEPMPYQNMYFSTMSYSLLQPVFPKKAPMIANDELELRKYSIVLLTGIATTKGLLNYLNQFCSAVVHHAYPDHHWFSTDELQKAYNSMQALQGKNRMIITTEKDAVRIAAIPGIPDEMLSVLYYLPIAVTFLDEKEDFDQKIFKAIKNFKSVSKDKTRFWNSN